MMWLILSFSFVTCALAYGLNTGQLTKKIQQVITLHSSFRSYFVRDDDGKYKLVGGKPYHVEGESDFYSVKASFSPSDTAFFIFDPWNNMPSKFLNKYYGHITNNYILPLARLANRHGYYVYIFTNDCKEIKPAQYSCSISKKFNTLIEPTSKTKIVYWQGLNPTSFSENLQKLGIKKIIYTGFASNICILERPTGMFKMKSLGFLLYFVPEASAAVELTNTWDEKYIHKAATEIISQSLARIIHYKNLYAALDSVNGEKRTE